MRTVGAAAIAAASVTILVAGCVTTLTKEIDWHDRPVSEVVTRLGRPASVLQLRPPSADWCRAM